MILVQSLKSKLEELYYQIHYGLFLTRRKIVYKLFIQKFYWNSHTIN